MFKRALFSYNATFVDLYCLVTASFYAKNSSITEETTTYFETFQPVVNLSTDSVFPAV